MRPPFFLKEICLVLGFTILEEIQIVGNKANIFRLFDSQLCNRNPPLFNILMTCLIVQNADCY